MVQSKVASTHMESLPTPKVSKLHLANQTHSWTVCVYEVLLEHSHVLRVTHYQWLFSYHSHGFNSCDRDFMLCKA